MPMPMLRLTPNSRSITRERAAMVGMALAAATSSRLVSGANQSQLRAAQSKVTFMP
jgi:hypothetical protein